MIHITKLKTLLLLLIICSAQSSALALDDVEAGKKLYIDGKFDKAARCFQSAIAEDPDDATAHYLLANSFLALKQFAAAIAEYRTASQLDYSGTAGRYSRQALTSLSSTQAALITASPKPEISNKTGQTKGDTTDRHHSVTAISKQADEQSLQAETECNAKVKRMLAEGDGRVNKLEQEMRERIQANGNEAWSGAPGCRRAVKYYDPEPENRVIRDEYAPKIEAIKAEYRKRADEIIAMYKQKTAAVEDSAITLDSSYLQESKGVRLNPLRTDMHVRSYETSDEPSGAAVPVQAAPAKALPRSSSGR